SSLPGTSLKKSPVDHSFLANHQSLGGRIVLFYKLGISYGFSEFNPAEPLEIDQLIDIADQDMYKMKQEIRNKY
ncbi:MAG TPA: hypothetical protein DD730_20475, partial [Desulfosporosinus sp.]|nr:hypothetical protein [Desulfosporosinus sp.]